MGDGASAVLGETAGCPPGGDCRPLSDAQILGSLNPVGTPWIVRRRADGDGGRGPEVGAGPAGDSALADRLVLFWLSRERI